MQRITYRSTRTRRNPAGKDPSACRRSADMVSIEEAIARGMPDDGGLYVPSGLPPLPARVFDSAPLGYAELASLVLRPFFPDWEDGTLESILKSAYCGPSGPATLACFDKEEISPLVPLPGLSAEIDGNGGMEISLLELFHGRTGAFKDMALSVLGDLLKESLKCMGEDRTALVLTATSGDTGSATLAGFADMPDILQAVLYPAEGTSDIQRLQMITQDSRSCFVAGVRGNFDDAQRTAKQLFGKNRAMTAGLGSSPGSSHEGLFPGILLSSANSINIGRLLPQIVYYVKAWRDLATRGRLGPGQLMNVAVPSGNFGDILAAKYAKEMGLPIGRLLCASNANKVLADFFATGVYDRRRNLVKTDSPSMDILVSSNLERLLFMASGGNSERTAGLMEELGGQGWFEIDADEKKYLADFSGGWCGDASARSAIAQVWQTDGILIDPHTATAVEVLQRNAGIFGNSGPVVVAATASPFKFPEVCLAALGEGSNDKASDGDTTPVAVARRLSSLTGIPLPTFILDLEKKPVVHEAILDLDEVEPALAAFAASAKARAQ
ncbi:MAG: threonine synthase [Spirochaetaceae bacterium]|nr:threonine synthase [Spirochaetaceae bacterium]